MVTTGRVQSLAEVVESDEDVVREERGYTLRAEDEEACLLLPEPV